MKARKYDKFRAAMDSQLPFSSNNSSLPSIIPYLNSISHKTEKGLAIHFYLSELLPYDHQPFQILEIFSRLKQVFAPLVGKAFILKNDDLVYISVNNSMILVERCLSQFRRILFTDSFINSNLKSEPFYAFHPLRHKFSEFQEMMTKIDQNPLYNNKDLDGHTNAQANKVPLLISGINLETLSLIENSIKNSDISIFLKREPIVMFDKDYNPTVQSYHYYVSLDALQSYLKVNEPLAANIWLFRQIGFYLDKQVLQSLPGFMDQKNVPAVNVNLNLRTLVTSTFQNFLRHSILTKKLTFDVDVVDFMAHPEAFEYALKMLHEKGCQLGLCGLTVTHIDYINFSALAVDSLKFVWNSTFVNNLGKLKNMVERVGHDKIVLTKCDSETAIQTGILGNVLYFHGQGLDPFFENATFRS